MVKRSRQRVAELGQTLTDAAVDRAEPILAEDAPLLATTQEWYELIAIRDPEERRRREAEIRSRPPEPPPEPMSPLDLTDAVTRAIDRPRDLETENIRLSDRIEELEGKNWEERIATLERANRIQSDHIRGLMTRDRSEPSPRPQQHDDDGWEYYQTDTDYFGEPIFSRRPKRR
jgi:hypothetical protein